jgi:hypothetical protein
VEVIYMSVEAICFLVTDDINTTGGYDDDFKAWYRWEAASGQSYSDLSGVPVPFRKVAA